MMAHVISLLLASLGHTCDPLLPRQSPPLNIHDLRIDDFKVIMAMGDSMTAGFNGAAKADMKEHRGLGFSIGGDRNAVTLPNLIAAVKGNGELVGPSIGTLSKPTINGTCAGADVSVCRLGSAVDGADLQDLIDLQINYLNHTLGTAPWAANVSILEDWKLLTIFSGLDDAVFYNTTDTHKLPTSPELFATNLDRLLHSVYAVFPRTFVNLVLLPENFQPKITTAHLTCKLFKWYSEHVGIHWTDTHLWIATIKRYNEILIEVANTWNLKGMGDFGVAPQPFMQEAQLELSDMDSLDCFHPNLASHQGMAVALWNNMHASSYAEKSRDWKQQQNATCPKPASRLVLSSESSMLVV
ncbi:unnamed protein product [Prorocentrum cordatum]|uniref:SGNH hydrolase-type esterase domain-containing protein n=1 Tax=Prorocentrum cordatum TaxID=2364126 RepID=A0ABN9QQ43_9DINO|nr:unnamed protein product [Polarella glacialis]|mmetsp:Transcript_26044/g.68933  ORF Transcript_26044/g.68933 Transcript_26044/m.68933 type:complete len:355 (+) Transcript_26044:149-1213(+)